MSSIQVKILRVTLLCIGFQLVVSATAQPNGEKLGNWLMYFWNTELKETKFGFQGDVQYRSWNAQATDLEQLLLRGGLTYRPTSTPLKLTLGYAFIQSQAYGPQYLGINENRVYQELLFPHKIGDRYFLTHRFRYEQRWVQGLDFRTRYRYNIFLNIPLNQTDLTEGALYLAFYNELFVNGQRDIGLSEEVALFDRDRLYSAVGYSIRDSMRIQIGYMHQWTANWDKGQMQFSFHHTF